MDESNQIKFVNKLITYNIDIYEWVDFSKFSQIWAKTGSSLRKFSKNCGGTSLSKPNLRTPSGISTGYWNYAVN